MRKTPVNTIEMRRQNDSWIGTFVGAESQKYLYKPLRERLENLCNAMQENEITQCVIEDAKISLKIV
jgi:hypothetical protein